MPPEATLWHIPVSHYNEKVRWALDYKGVEHERKAPPPPSHMPISLWLTRGSSKTFPVLRLDAEVYGDSSAIIEALERRFPEPALYPDDPEQRQRALEVEDYFDEQVASHVRLLAWHEAIKDKQTFGEFASDVLPPAMSKGPGRLIAGPFAAQFLKLRYGVADTDSAALARTRIEQAFDRLDSELGEGGYLVGDEFSVADLTAASILYPIVRPPEGPRVLFEYAPPLEEFRLSFAERPGYAYVEQMFRRHRKRAAAPAAA